MDIEHTQRQETSEATVPNPSLHPASLRADQVQSHVSENISSLSAKGNFLEKHISAQRLPNPSKCRLETLGADWPPVRSRSHAGLHQFYCAVICSWWQGFPRGSDGKESACNAGDLGSIPELGRSSGEGTTPVLLPGKSHGQRSLAGYSPWGHQESGMTE